MHRWQKKHESCKVRNTPKIVYIYGFIQTRVVKPHRFHTHKSCFGGIGETKKNWSQQRAPEAEAQVQYIFGHNNTEYYCYKKEIKASGFFG